MLVLVVVVVEMWMRDVEVGMTLSSRFLDLCHLT